MSEAISAALLLIGGGFMLLAGVGIVRMPDLFTRMQTATKAATLGAGCTLLAVAVHFQLLGVTSRALLIIGFVLLTAPVAAHVIARAAYSGGVPLWQGSVRDELRDARVLGKMKLVAAEETPAEAAGPDAEDPAGNSDPINQG